MRKLILVLFMLLAIGFAPTSAEPSTDCTWEDTIMTLTHIQANVDYHEGGDASKLIAEAEAALQSTNCLAA